MSNCACKSCGYGQTSALGLTRGDCGECPVVDTCGPKEWRMTICVTRCEDVMLVFSTSAGTFEAFDSGFGSEAVLRLSTTLPAGSSLQLSWVPRPGVTPTEARCNDLNTIREVVGDNGMVAVSMVSELKYSAIPGTQHVHTPPSVVNGEVVVSKGTVATLSNIGVV